MSAHSFLNSRNELSFSTALPSSLDLGARASLGADTGAAGFFGGGGGGTSSSSSNSSSSMKSSSSIILRAEAALVGFLLLPPNDNKWSK